MLARLLAFVRPRFIPTEVVITDDRPFTDADVWTPFPIRDGEPLSEW